MKQLYRWIMSLLFVHVGIVPIQGSSSIPTNDILKFGFKLGYVSGLYSGWNGFDCFAPEVFITYHFEPIDKGPHYPLFGFWGNRYESYAVQAGICYKAINMRLSRYDIDDQAAWLSYPREEIRSVDFSLKTLSLPISIKYCIGKNRKFCITTGIAPLFIFSVYKKDWVAELANQPGQELLKKEIYKNNANRKCHEMRYNDLDPELKRQRKAFYNTWKKRKEADQRTYLSTSSVFNGRIGLEWRLLGIEYETNGGFILNWDILNCSFFGNSQVAISSIFSIGYNFYTRHSAQKI